MKKSRFFLKKNWKKYIILGMFCFLFACLDLNGESFKVERHVEKSTIQTDLEYENSIVQGRKKSIKRLKIELANALVRVRKQEEKYNILLLEASSIFAGDGRINSEKLARVEELDLYVKHGSILVFQLERYFAELEDGINKTGDFEAQRADLRYKLERLRRVVKKFGILTGLYSRSKTQLKCRVLDVNDNLQVIVLSAGLLDGVRAGLTLRLKDANNAVIKVIALRPYVSAAVVVDGEHGDIVPGMLAEIDESKRKVKTDSD